MIGEIAKAAEVAGEAAKGMSEETKKMVKELDKPLNASDVKEAGDIKENDFKDLLKELDRPLNAELEREAEPQTERKPNLPEDEGVPENDCLQNGSDANQELERQEISKPVNIVFGIYIPFCHIFPASFNSSIYASISFIASSYLSPNFSLISSISICTASSNLPSSISSF